MSAASYVTIWCDRSPDSDLMSCGEYVEGDRADDARKNAKARGWAVAQRATGTHYGRAILRDYCPEHRAGFSTDTPEEAEK